MLLGPGLGHGDSARNKKEQGQREVRMRNYKQIHGATIGIAIPLLLAVYLAFLMLWQTARALHEGGHSLSPDWNSDAGGPSPSRVLLLEEVGVGGERGVLFQSHFWEWGRWAWEAQPVCLAP